MALTGCTQHTIKEFNYAPGGIAVRLSQGFDGDVPSYYSIDKRTGLNLPMGHDEYGRIYSQILSCTQENYRYLAREFKKIVNDML